MKKALSAARWLSLLLLIPLTVGCEPTEAGSHTSLQDLANEAQAQIEGEIVLEGLQEPVEVLRDEWGIAHIYANNMDDLFFAQGFVHAQDRLWQMEMWRRTAEGRMAEVLGADGLEHDRIARLLKYRGPWDDREFTVYHEDGERIVAAFANGVNAFIEQRRDHWPVEFRITGVEPLPWDVTTPLPRLFTAMPVGNARAELRLAQQVAELGAEEANRQAGPDPWRELEVPEGLDVTIITEEVIDGLGGFRSGMPAVPLLREYRDLPEGVASIDLGPQEPEPGSNNWAIRPELSETGAAIVVNDPHRGVTNPSLRYLVHLNAPEWNVIGATEPGIPGIAIGHNGRVAWGLTVVGTDQSDVFVEEVNPENRDEVLWEGNWEPLRIEYDTIQVRDGEDEIVELKFSRHGPIFYEDTVNHRAYAIRSTMHEPGSAGYMGALRLNQVDDCSEFLDELVYYYAPSENMVCGDADGNISWMAAALTPNRIGGWHGRLPVPGTGQYRWEGFRDDLPTELNPDRGWIATANHNIHPPGYDPPLFFKSGPPYPRFERLDEVLSEEAPFSVEDFEQLLHDSYSARGDRERSLMEGWTGESEDIEWARQEVAQWDGFFGRRSVGAAIYQTWRGHVDNRVFDDGTPVGDRHELAHQGMEETVADLQDRFGDDTDDWYWGRIHRSEFPHPLVEAYDLPPVERGGGAGTVAATGATFREIIDFADLDNSRVSSAPGQSARPGSPFYGNLREMWGDEEFFPLLYTREAIEANSEFTLTLTPG
jgi:penicillin G amidase